eukprot:3645613-Rhodomonas_salina.1
MHGSSIAYVRTGYRILCQYRTSHTTEVGSLGQSRTPHSKRVGWYRSSLAQVSTGHRIARV